MQRRFVGLMVSATAIFLYATAVANAGPSDVLHNRTWALRHLGANGLEKCRAFRLVRKHTAQLQVAGGGTITAGERGRLETELGSAKAMPPRSLTPFQCGVPL
jgi:hypothetical protein